MIVAVTDIGGPICKCHMTSYGTHVLITTLTSLTFGPTLPNQPSDVESWKSIGNETPMITNGIWFVLLQ